MNVWNFFLHHPLDDAIMIDDHKPIDPPTDPIDPGKFIQLVEKVKGKKLSNYSY